MDTSETYIKMSDYEEIQAARGRYAVIGSIWWFKGSNLLPEGVCTYHRGKGQVVSGMWDEEDWMSLSIAPNLFIWLPQQDELQEMIPDHSFLNLIDYVWHEFSQYDGDGSVFATPKYLMNVTSMDQLWLAFVQKELHNKVWDGEEWSIMQ